MTADAFLKFCREPEAWPKFLRDSGVEDVLVGPDGRFFRSAAYQCLRLLPTPRAARRLVESVYAATYCDREASDGRYGGSELVELPYRFASQADRDTAEESLVRVEVAPTTAAASIAVVPGISRVLLETRDSPAFQQLQKVVRLLGESDSALPTEAAFRTAWQDLCGTYTEHSVRFLTQQSQRDKVGTRYAVFAYILSRVLGYLILPESPIGKELEVLEDAAVIGALEHLGPGLLRSFRALLKTPRTRDSMLGAAAIRCSRVPLNVQQN